MKGTYFKHWRKRKLKKSKSKSPSVSADTLDQPQNSSPATSHKNTFHHSCQTLLYGNFLNAVLLDDLSFLVISGKPSEEDLREAFEKIKFEYASTLQTPKSKVIFNCWKDMEFLILKRRTSWVCINFLKKVYSKKAAEALCEMGYEYLTEETCKDRLWIVENECKTLDLLIEQAKSTYLSVIPSDSNETKTMADYEKDLAYISKYMGGGIIKKFSITVSEYISMVNIFVEQEEKKKNGK